MLTVVRETTVPRKSDGFPQRAWIVRCDCGVECVKLVGNVSRGRALSCGCGQGIARKPIAKPTIRHYHLIEVSGESLTLDELAALCGIGTQALRLRLKRHGSAEEALRSIRWKALEERRRRRADLTSGRLEP